MPRWWNRKDSGYTFTQGESKAEAKFTAPKPPMSSAKPPPVPDTPQMKATRAAYDKYVEQAAQSDNNWGGFGWEFSHSQPLNFALMDHDTHQPRHGGTQWHQKDRTDQVPWTGPPDAGNYQGRTGRGPPPPIMERRELPRRAPMERLQRIWNDPRNQPSPPIIDLRGSGGPVMGPDPPMAKPYSSWPGDEQGPQGHGRGHP